MRDKEAVLVEIATFELRLEQLRQELAEIEVQELKNVANEEEAAGSEQAAVRKSLRWPLPTASYRRYGRQMIMPEIGLKGQLKLSKASVLIVGLGGLGCPAAAYLSGAGVSRLGLIDGDTVELSNLHRQILHTNKRIGVHKVHSATEALQQLNPNVKYEAYTSHLTPQTALDIFSQYDLILDCTDHPTSRYLISDAAVLAGKPLVSASALKTDGQLVVLNYPPTPLLHEKQGNSTQPGPVASPGGPCYRCIFPKPPPPDSVVSCGEGGILGPVVGTMGVLMALEALKVLTAAKHPEANAPTLLHLFSAYPNTTLRSMKMKGKRANCMSCGESRSITRESLVYGSLDYIAFCGVTNPIQVLDDTERVSAAELAKVQQGLEVKAFAGGKQPVIIDVRDKTLFELASLPNAINIPFSEFGSNRLKTATDLPQVPEDGSPLLFVCRLGNDSQMAARRMKELGSADGGRWVGDLRGGLRAWRNEVEPDWPDC